MNPLVVEENAQYPSSEAVSGDTSTYLAVLESGRPGWGAYVPDLPGVIAAGDTEEEARRLITEAVRRHVEELRATGDDVPEASASLVWVEA